MVYMPNKAMLTASSHNPHLIRSNDQPTPNPDIHLLSIQDVSIEYMCRMCTGATKNHHHTTFASPPPGRMTLRKHDTQYYCSISYLHMEFDTAPTSMSNWPLKPVSDVLVHNHVITMHFFGVYSLSSWREFCTFVWLRRHGNVHSPFAKISERYCQISNWGLCLEILPPDRLPLTPTQCPNVISPALYLSSRGRPTWPSMSLPVKTLSQYLKFSTSVYYLEVTKWEKKVPRDRWTFLQFFFLQCAPTIFFPRRKLSGVTFGQKYSTTAIRSGESFNSSLYYWLVMWKRWTLSTKNRYQTFILSFYYYFYKFSLRNYK